MSASFVVGDEVMARWEGSKQYYKARIIRKLRTQNVQVEFEDGEQNTVHVKDLRAVAGQSPRRRSSRTKKTPSPEKQSRKRSSSRGRSKSPSRSPSRSKKPPPTPPTPRRSRSRSAKSAEAVETMSLKLKEVEIPLEKVVFPEERRYPKRNSAAEVKASFQDKEISTPPGGGKCPRGGALVSFIMILVTNALPIYLYLACTKNKAIVLGIPPVPRRFFNYFSLKAAASYLAWIFFQAILMLLPLGKMTAQPGQPQMLYRMNGLACLLLTVAGVCGVAYYRLLPLSFFWENQLRFVVCSVVFSFVASFFLYVKSFFNPGRLASHSGNFFYDFYLGRELNPRLLATFDLKFFFLRLGFLSWALVDSLLVYKYYVGHGCVSYPLAAITFMQVLYIVDNLKREEMLLATATFLYDGMGSCLTSTFGTLFPFVYSLPVLYLTTLGESQQQPARWLALHVVVCVVGLVLLHKSQADKYAFKSNPFSPSLSYMVTIPAGYTRSLIASGVWGFVRHPNYLGEILIFVSWTLPCGFDSALPYIPVVLTLLGLVVRCLILEGHTQKRHGQAWIHYAARVRYRIIPFVF